MEKITIQKHFEELNEIFFKKYKKNNPNKKSIINREDNINILSPGRINLIGEHTDYNLGLSINAAIDKYIFIIGSKNNMDYIEIFSRNINDSVRFHINDIQFDRNKKWVNYIKGVLKEYIKKGHKICGFDMIIDSTLDIGAGISSSASLEVGVAKFIQELINLKVEKNETVKLCNRAENNFVGVNSGLLDQFSIVHGKNNNVTFLNFKDLSYEYIPFYLKDDLILIINSKEDRNLADTGYNERRKECMEAVELISNVTGKEITSLSDISLDLLNKLNSKMPDKLYKRVKHVVTENNRVLSIKRLLVKENIKQIGKILFESHSSLKCDYEVSTEKLDYLVDELRKIEGVYGGRLMGGGFGGSIISIVKRDKIKIVTDIIGNKYLNKFNIIPGFIKCLLSDGTRRINF